MFVSELAQAKYVTPVFSSKLKYEKLASVIRILQNTQNFVILQRTTKKCTKIYNAHAQPLFLSLKKCISISIRQISGFVLLLLLMLMSRVFSPAYAYVMLMLVLMLIR